MENKSINEFVNKVIQGDCLEVLKKIPDNSVDLVLTDPPYNIGIDVWDKIENYENWLIKIFIECERVLKKNGTFWFFHTNFNTISSLNEKIKIKTSFLNKQIIIINKGLQSVAGRSSINLLRSFPKATEYLLFYTFKDLSGVEQLVEEDSMINPMSKYLKKQFIKADVTNNEIAKLFPSKTGGLTGCVSNWLNGFNFPTKKQYIKIRNYLNKEEYKYLIKEYEDLKKEYEDLRYTFNLSPRMTDVWDINFYSEKRYLHPTQKPLKLISRIIKASSNKNDIVLDPFLGSGTTAVACKNLGRKYIGIEISKEYCDIAEKRIRAIPEKLEKWFK